MLYIYSMLETSAEVGGGFFTPLMVGLRSRIALDVLTCPSGYYHLDTYPPRVVEVTSSLLWRQLPCLYYNIMLTLSDTTGRVSLGIFFCPAIFFISFHYFRSVWYYYVVKVITIYLTTVAILDGKNLSKQPVVS